MTVRTLLLTTVAMLAFAANSLLCRLALGAHLIDAASFTTMRAVAGALMLSLIALFSNPAATRPKSGWLMPFTLYAYMICFSFAYLSLGAGTGALVLFGAVQLTMFTVALRRGENFTAMSWCGLALAIAGLLYLVFPGVTAPDPLGAVLMAIAGISWGAYSLLGRGSDPLPATVRNFRLSVPLALLSSVVFASHFTVSAGGLAFAIASGALASGCGYVIWYAALKGLSATSAATVQLSVPAIAAIGGTALLSEALTLRLVLASIAMLGGVAIVLSQRAAVVRSR